MKARWSPSIEQMARVPPLGDLPPPVHPSANAMAGFGAQSESHHNGRPLVMHNGSTSVRAGWANAEGTPTPAVQLWFCDPWGSSPHDEGSSAAIRPDLSTPERGGDYEPAQSILPLASGAWSHVISQMLGVDPHDHPLILTERPLEGREARELAAQCVFEELQSPALYLLCTGVSALYSTGNTTGSVIISGEEGTHFVPIYEGYRVPDAIKRMPLAGKHLTAHCHALLMGTSHPHSTPLALQLAGQIRRIKHRCATADAAAAADTADAADAVTSALACTELAAATAALALRDGAAVARRYVLPDGREMVLPSPEDAAVSGQMGCSPRAQSVPDGCTRLGRAMFEPSLVGAACPPLQDVVWDGIACLDVSLRAEMTRDCFVCGGNTHAHGFEAALSRHLKANAPKSYRVNVRQADGRRQPLGGSTASGGSALAAWGEDEVGVPAPWLGAAILAGLSSLSEMWVTRKEYEDEGPRVVHRKCYV